MRRQFTVSIPIDVKQRYDRLDTSLPFSIRVKQLVCDFIDRWERERLAADRARNGKKPAKIEAQEVLTE